MILCQITDLHIKQDGKFAYGRVDTAAALARCIERINTLDPRPDAIVITGDLVDMGREAEYQMLRQLLDPLTIPYYLIVGNHDHREHLQTVFADHAYLQGERFIQYAVDLGEIRLIALDTQNPPHSGGTLCAARLAWLSEQLAASKGKPTVIAMHHPPFTTGIAHMDAIGLDQAAIDALMQCIKPYANVERVICGHLHRPIQVRFAGTLASTSPAPAHQVALDLNAEGEPGYVMEPGGFMLHLWHPQQGLISHQGYIDQADGPYPFFEDDGALID